MVVVVEILVGFGGETNNGRLTGTDSQTDLTDKEIDIGVRDRLILFYQFQGKFQKSSLGSIKKHSISNSFILFFTSFSNFYQFQKSIKYSFH